jgi:hypothetical protein
MNGIAIALLVTIPAVARQPVDAFLASHPTFRLVSDVERASCPKPVESVLTDRRVGWSSIVYSDLNGDGRRDVGALLAEGPRYNVVVWHRSGRGWSDPIWVVRDARIALLGLAVWRVTEVRIVAAGCGSGEVLEFTWYDRYYAAPPPY